MRPRSRSDGTEAELHGTRPSPSASDGELNKNGLRTAKSGGHGVGAVEDLNDDL
ncbi:hypothetical protein [Natronococcus occultus]|uniref:hypothetical protein n=1 Tax=Natronococcus occultus TaxID=29288 RepID=UPI0012F9DB97|nr:hypothetical protein [Natronococcus occultus]